MYVFIINSIFLISKTFVAYIIDFYNIQEAIANISADLTFFSRQRTLDIKFKYLKSRVAWSVDLATSHANVAQFFSVLWEAPASSATPKKPIIRRREFRPHWSNAKVDRACFSLMVAFGRVALQLTIRGSGRQSPVKAANGIWRTIRDRVGRSEKIKWNFFVLFVKGEVSF